MALAAKIVAAITTMHFNNRDSLNRFSQEIALKRLRNLLSSIKCIRGRISDKDSTFFNPGNVILSPHNT